MSARANRDDIIQAATGGPDFTPRESPDPIPTATPLSAAEDEDGRITEGSVTPGGHRIGPKAWRLIVSTSNHDDYIGAILDVIDEAAARQPVVDGVLDPPCQHESCTEVFASDSENSAAIIALAWALSERSADGPHGTNERRRFRPLARSFLQDLLRDPRRAAAVRDALAARLGASDDHS